MKTYFSIFIIAAAGLLFTACKKEVSYEGGNATATPTTPVMPATPAITGTDSLRVKTYTEDLETAQGNHYTITYTLAYNAGNKLTGATAVWPVSKCIVTYPGATQYRIEYFDGSLVTIHEDYFLNAGLFTDSIYQYNNTEDTTTEKYFYNAGNQVVKINRYYYSKATGSILSYSTTNTYNSDGDLMLASATNNTSAVYEYYTSLSYVTPIAIGVANANTTKKMHLIKKYTLNNNGVFVTSANYTYTFDARDRISTEKETYNDGNIFTRSYTYFLQ